MKILLAVDGSPCSDAAIKEVADRVWPPHSEIRVITAYESPLVPTPETWVLPSDYFDKLDCAAREQAESTKDAALRKLDQSLGTVVGVSSDVFSGPPSSVILDEAERWKADLIMVGSHGYGPWQRFLMGSVSQAVVSHAKCSVEVVRLRNQPASAKAA